MQKKRKNKAMNIEEMGFSKQDKELFEVALIAEGLKIEVNAESTQDELKEKVLKALLDNKKYRKKYLDKYITVWYTLEKEQLFKDFVE